MDHDVQPRTRVGIIGAGRVGRALARASRRAGLDVAAAWSRTEHTRQRVAGELAIPVATSLDEAVVGCDIVIVAVPDEQLAAVLLELAGRIDDGAAPLVVVTSGSSSIELGESVRTAGGRVVRIHPLRAITDVMQADALDGVVAAVTASGDADGAAARELATRLGMVPFELADADASTWHAAGSIAAGGVTTLLAAARDLAVLAGLEPDAALRAMADLARGAIDQAVTQSPEAALTGPVVRGDAGTVAAHVAAIQARRPDLVDPYRAVARASADLAHRSGRIDDDVLARIDEAIGDGPTVDEVVTTWA